MLLIGCLPTEGQRPLTDLLELSSVAQQLVSDWQVR